MLKLSDFDYFLPPELIAQYPSARRGQSRLMIVTRSVGRIETAMFRDIMDRLERGDALVLNDTKVFPARLRARKLSTGARIEILLLRETEEALWEALVKPGRRAPKGAVLSIEGARQADTAEVISDQGKTKILRFSVSDVRRLCRRVGEIPLPPYIKRPAESSDARRYQTVYATNEGAVAAPTAGLHFTPAMLNRVRDRGVSLEYVTLHTGFGTFQPLEYEEVEQNELHAERYRLSPATARRLNEVRRRGRKVIAVGTTTLRLMETTVTGQGEFVAGEGLSSIFIYPGHIFHSADALITNFHLPRSSLFLLVCAFAGRDLTLKAYETAVKERFRFYSYGDAMLIL
ncbi:tRNA preQ1(34) S-adenosylmethionine ribosyltransferase-isomerase QueA [Candidatus Poribacteria bacterium]|nr:tRNA preQ1(34) S-adenosylmethionine ribosyltransferase-isomerase QueA [Candidatus Poribacteria bacterium]